MIDHVGLNVRKPVLWVSDQFRLKPAFSATEASWDIAILPGANLTTKLSRYVANNKGANQTAQMFRLVCTFVVKFSCVKVHV